MPKSITLSSPPGTSMIFSGFKSRCAIDWRCASARPAASWRGASQHRGHDQVVAGRSGRGVQTIGTRIFPHGMGIVVALLKRAPGGKMGQGLDTVEANHALGFKADCRDFALPAAILHELGVKRVRLLSNNPRKASALTENGVEVVVSGPGELWKPSTAPTN